LLFRVRPADAFANLIELGEGNFSHARAVQVAMAGFGAVDWLLFHGHNTAFILHLMGG